MTNLIQPFISGLQRLWSTGMLATGALGIGLVLGNLSGGWLASLRYGAEIATLNAVHANTLRAVSDAAAADSEAVRQREHQFQQQLALLDTQHQQELSNANRDTLRLRADVDTGRRRMQFANAALATCEQSAGAVRRASRVGDDATLRLTPLAGRYILDIRTGINQDQAKLRYLQAYVRALQEQGVIAH